MLIQNFLYEVCHAEGDWTMGDYCKNSPSEAIREKVGDGKVLLALSGGVDSSVAAALLAEAVGNQLTCVFVDHGLMRKNEGDEVEAAFCQVGHQLHPRECTSRRFLRQAGQVLTEPEHKRKIIGEEFIRTFEKRTSRLVRSATIDYLAQGTIYPDVHRVRHGRCRCDQEPPQRRRSAGFRGLQGDHRAAAYALQG